MRLSVLGFDGAVQSVLHDERAVMPAGSAALAVRMGDWVVGADGPEDRPMVVALQHSQLFATEGEMHVRIRHTCS